MKNPRHILITGASSGLGAALAQIYAAPGVQLTLQGRNAARLNQTTHKAEKLGATVNAHILDVTDALGMRHWIEEADRLCPLDLVIANAGISANSGTDGESEEAVASIFETNLTGVLNTINAALPMMKERKRGQIALMSSLASFRGAPKAGAYCASKAAVRLLGEALRPELATFGVQLSVICPGFIKTPLTDANNFPMLFLMKASDAADQIKKGLAANKARIAFPLPMVWLVKLYTALPFGLIDRWMIGLPEKRKETPIPPKAS